MVTQPQSTPAPANPAPAAADTGWPSWATIGTVAGAALPVVARLHPSLRMVSGAHWLTTGARVAGLGTAGYFAGNAADTKPGEQTAFDSTVKYVGDTFYSTYDWASENRFTATLTVASFIPVVGIGTRAAYGAIWGIRAGVGMLNGTRVAAVAAPAAEGGAAAAAATARTWPGFARDLLFNPNYSLLSLKAAGATAGGVIARAGLTYQGLEQTSTVYRTLPEGITTQPVAEMPAIQFSTGTYVFDPLKVRAEQGQDGRVYLRGIQLISKNGGMAKEVSLSVAAVNGLTPEDTTMLVHGANSTKPVAVSIASLILAQFHNTVAIQKSRQEPTQNGTLILGEVQEVKDAKGQVIGYSGITYQYPDSAQTVPVAVSRKPDGFGKVTLANEAEIQIPQLVYANIAAKAQAVMTQNAALKTAVAQLESAKPAAPQSAPATPATAPAQAAAGAAPAAATDAAATPQTPATDAATPPEQPAAQAKKDVQWTTGTRTSQEVAREQYRGNVEMTVAEVIGADRNDETKIKAAVMQMQLALKARGADISNFKDPQGNPTGIDGIAGAYTISRIADVAGVKEIQELVGPQVLKPAVKTLIEEGKALVAQQQQAQQTQPAQQPAATQPQQPPAAATPAPAAGQAEAKTAEKIQGLPDFSNAKYTSDKKDTIEGIALILVNDKGMPLNEKREPIKPGEKPFAVGSVTVGVDGKGGYFIKDASGKTESITVQQYNGYKNSFALHLDLKDIYKADINKDQKFSPEELPGLKTAIEAKGIVIPAGLTTASDQATQLLQLAVTHLAKKHGVPLSQ